MTTAEILEAAANKIERDGWWCPGRVNGAHCAAFAITRAAGHQRLLEANNSPAMVAFARALNAPGEPFIRRSAIYEWNDAPERTKEEVIAMLRAVAATERARESLGDATPEALPQNTAVSLDALEALPA